MTERLESVPPGGAGAGTDTQQRFRSQARSSSSSSKCMNPTGGGRRGEQICGAHRASRPACPPRWETRAKRDTPDHRPLSPPLLTPHLIPLFFILEHSLLI